MQRNRRKIPARVGAQIKAAARLHLIGATATDLAEGVEKGRMKAGIEPQCGPQVRARLLEASREQRKAYPVTSGVLDYFPDAVAAVSEVSFHGNQQHNPGQPLHWARGKSMDHADCIARHLIERGGFDGKIRHSAALAWRALALLQEELEAEHNLAAPRGAKDVA